METKEFHIGVRCSLLAREYTKEHLKKHGWTVSSAFNRLINSQGLISATDKETIELCKKCLTKLRKVNIPLIERKGNLHSLLDWKKEHLEPWRKDAVTSMMRLILDLESGEQPIYLYDLEPFTTREINLSVIDGYYSRIQVAENVLLTWEPEKLAKRLEKIYRAALDNPDKDYNVEGNYFKSRYTIRCRLLEMPTFKSGGKVIVKSNRYSYDSDFSHLVRNKLNYIHDIPSKSNPNTIAKLNSFLEALDDLQRHITGDANYQDTLPSEEFDKLDKELSSISWNI